MASVIPTPTVNTVAQSLMGQGGNQPNWGQMQYEQDRIEQAAVEKRDRVNRYNQWLTDSIANAPNWATAYTNSIGLNAADPSIQAVIQRVIGNISSKAPRDLDTGVNPESYFSPEAFDQGFSDEQSRARQANTAQVRGRFAPGFESQLLPDSDIDNIVNEIIGEQRGLANTKLGYQSKRGLLTPQGTEQANKSLANQESAGRSTVSSLARSALDKDRSAINDIVSQAGSAASSWMFGNPQFSVDPYQQQVNERASRERAGFGGDVRAALGNTQLFDIPSVVAQAGVAQGSDNLNFGSIPTGGKKKPTERGLGSSGGGF